MGIKINKITTQALNHKNQGAALITVLVVIFVVTSIIANIALTNYRSLRRLTNQKIATQANYILTASIDFGRAGLATSGATSAVDSLNDIWAQPIPKTKVVGDMELSGYIVDEQSKFNINDVVNAGHINQNNLNKLVKLFNYLNIPSQAAYNIAYYMASPEAEGATVANQYTMSIPPYRPAGRPIVDLSELILVKGMEKYWVQKLYNYLTAIPEDLNYLGQFTESGLFTESSPPPSPYSPGGSVSSMNINVNTASAEVIAAISGIPLEVASRMVAIRSETPFNSTTLNTFLNSNGIISSDLKGIDTSTLTTQSQYFTIHATVTINDYEFKWVALVNRENRQGQWPKVLWQHPG